MLRAFPIDSNALSPEIVRVEPQTDRDGTQRQDRDHVPQWDVAVNVFPPAGAPDLLVVTVSGRERPKVEKGQQVRFTGLSLIPWERSDRHGLFVRADEVSALPAQVGESKPKSVASGAAA